jgi:polyhydroxyalkanoate synthesis regulator phasin
MTDEQTPDASDGGTGGDGEDGKAQDRSKRDAFEDRFKQGVGVLGAMKDAIEDAIREVKERGDLTPDRAKEVVRSALDKAQEKAEEARDALDFVKQKDFDGLKSKVEDLAARMGIVEGRSDVPNEESDGESS